MLKEQERITGAVKQRRPRQAPASQLNSRSGPSTSPESVFQSPHISHISSLSRHWGSSLQILHKHCWIEAERQIVPACLPCPPDKRSACPASLTWHLFVEEDHASPQGGGAQVQGWNLSKETRQRSPSENSLKADGSPLRPWAQQKSVCPGHYLSVCLSYCTPSLTSCSSPPSSGHLPWQARPQPCS